MSLVVHGSWSADAFFVWGESSESAPRRRGRKPRIPAHPQAASPEALRTLLKKAALLGEWDGVPNETRIVLLPSTADWPQLPPWLLPEAEDAKTESELCLSPWKVIGPAMDAVSALDLLVLLPLGDSPRRQWGSDLHYWGLVAKLGLELPAHHRYLPGITLSEAKGRYQAVWLPVLDDPHDRARLRALTQAMPPICRALFAKNEMPSADQALAPHALQDPNLEPVAADEVVSLLGVAGDQQARPTLWAVFQANHDDPERASTAAMSLAALGDTRVLPHVPEDLEAADEESVANAVASLIFLGELEDVDRLPATDLRHLTNYEIRTGVPTPSSPSWQRLTGLHSTAPWMRFKPVPLAAHCGPISGIPWIQNSARIPEPFSHTRRSIPWKKSMISLARSY